MIQIKNFTWVLLFSSVFLASCGKDDSGCTDPFSDNYDRAALKDDGSCIPWTAKFEGNWILREACQGGSTGAPIPVFISAGLNPEELGVFRRTDNTRVFTLILLNGQSFELSPYTYFAPAGLVEVTGQGSISNNRRTINIQTFLEELLGSGLTGSCNIVLEKQ